MKWNKFDGELAAVTFLDKEGNEITYLISDVKLKLKKGKYFVKESAPSSMKAKGHFYSIKKLTNK